MKKNNGILILLLYIFLPQILFCQSEKFYTSDRELPTSLINHIYQDSKGYVWIATENGLSKFDGIRFSLYLHNENDSTSLRNNYVHTLYEDSEGRLWIGSLSGLQQYDHATDAFWDISLQGAGSRGNPHVTSIIERKNGDIWVATSGLGILALNEGMDRTGFVLKSDLQTHLESHFINVLFEDSKENLWICTQYKGIFRYSPEKNEWKNYSLQGNRMINDVYSICELPDGTIMAGTQSGGLLSLPVDGTEFISIPYNNRQDLNIRILHVSSKGDLFIGTDGEGLKTYNPQQDRVEDYTLFSTSFDLDKSKVHSILEDKDGNLWLGLFQKGVLCVPGTGKDFGYIGHKSVHNNTIGSSFVTAIVNDPEDGKKYIGTDNDGIYVIDDSGKQLAHYPHSPGSLQSVPGGIMCMYIDSNRNFWIGSYISGLAKLNRKTGYCEYIEELSGYTNNPVRISTIMEDNYKKLWVGSYGSGLWGINLKDGKLFYHETIRTKRGIPNDWINTILKDRKGNLWLGTYTGIGVLNPDSLEFIDYIGGMKPIFSNYIVHSLLESRDGMLWVGTSKGLFRFNPVTGTYHNYTEADGLPSNVISALQEDPDGGLWISTHHGISKKILNSEKFLNYYAGDGLQGNEFSRNASMKDTNGKLWFGGVNGVTFFEPYRISEIKKQLQVYITEFYRDNRPVHKGDKSGNHIITNRAVMESDTFYLAYNENSFMIEFSVFEFSNPERINYRYKIEGINKDWISHPGVNLAAFNHLKPGKYRFLVQAYDHDNFSPIREINIIITPPWYQTWWAWCIWILSAIIVLYIICMYILSRIRHKQELIQHRHKEEINEAKLQFFTNISHEIRTPMTLIINPLEKLLKEESGKKGVYLMIYRNARRILELVNQLMDIRKLDKGQMKLKFRQTNLVAFIEDILQMFEYQAQKQDIRLILETEPEHEKEFPAWIDMQTFDKVIVNILSNAFKFTPKGGYITIHLSTGTDLQAAPPLQKYIEIALTDTGIGIAEEEVEKIFERFYQINNESGYNNFGTGIGLHLSKLFIELHQGTIYAVNRKDTSGSCFVIRIPAGNKHLEPYQIDAPQSAEENTQRINDSQILSSNQEEKEKKKVHISKRPRVLIVEDDHEIRQYICQELEPFFRIEECVNGRVALDYIVKEKPELVISDIMMPEMDGITLCRKIKENMTTSHIPVILLTAKSSTEDKVEGLNTGADAYLAKPFSTDELISTIHNLIKNRKLLKIKYVKEKEIEEKTVDIQLRSNDDILLEKIMKTINENLADPTLNVEMLAAHVGLSRVHVHRKLKEITNQSAHSLIRSVRMKQAARLLKEKNLTISEIAYATGFSTLSHFSKSFKEYYKTTPSEYLTHPEE